MFASDQLSTQFVSTASASRAERDEIDFTKAQLPKLPEDILSDGAEYIRDERLRKQVLESRKKLIELQLKAYQQNNSSEIPILGAFPAAAAGYAAAGVPGAIAAFKRTIGLSSALKGASFRTHHAHATLEMELMKTVGTVVLAESVEGPEWQPVECARAYVSENRGEWMFMPAAPVDADWSSETSRDEATNAAIVQESFCQGARERYFLDIVVGISRSLFSKSDSSKFI